MAESQDRSYPPTTLVSIVAGPDRDFPAQATICGHPSDLMKVFQLHGEQWYAEYAWVDRVHWMEATVRG